MSIFAAFKRSRLLIGVGTLTLGLAACDPVALDKPGDGGNTGTVQVALLVSSGTGDPGDEVIARDMENAARLAIADLGGSSIDLKVYSAGASAATGAAAAAKAAEEGAEIILGPLYGEAANAAAVAVAPKGINVLSFSNNATIAGGNLFLLGTTYNSTAGRLVSYAVRRGKGNAVIVHANNAIETQGRDAIAQALQANGGTVAGTIGFNFSQNDIINAVPKIASLVKSSGANAVFFTSTTDGAIPFLSELLPSNGVSSATSQFIGLQRWDSPANAPTLKGLQGGWFAAPDPALLGQFRARYATAYGAEPHPLAALAYDGMAAIGALAKSGQGLDGAALTRSAGFAGVNGVFRFRGDGTNQRALAIMLIQNNSVSTLDPAPRDFGSAGF